MEVYPQKASVCRGNAPVLAQSYKRVICFISREDAEARWGEI